MKPFDDEGRELDAIFSVEDTDDGIVRLVFESRGGAAGGPGARNRDYAPALELLLQRLGRRGAVLHDIEVYSSVTRSWPPENRKISAPGFPLPLRLAEVTDFTRLRHELGRASAALGRPPGQPGGNPTKRLRFFLDWEDQDVVSLGETYSGMLEGLLAEAPAQVRRRALRYDPLGAHLRARGEAEVRLTLGGIAKIVGAPLPDEARKPQFWSNASRHHATRRRQWLEAGFSASFERASGTVVFRRTAIPGEQPTDDPEELRTRARSVRAGMAAMGRGRVPPPGAAAPPRGTGIVTRYLRDPRVVAWVTLEADGRCEVCDAAAPFLTDDSLPFLEVRHVRPLAEGGPDTTDNAVAACPNCHRRLHLGADRELLRRATIAKVARLSDYPVRTRSEIPWLPADQRGFEDA